MKIKLSKSQWQSIGKQAGWTKEDKQIKKQAVTDEFSTDDNFIFEQNLSQYKDIESYSDYEYVINRGQNDEITITQYDQTKRSETPLYYLTPKWKKDNSTDLELENLTFEQAVEKARIIAENKEQSDREAEQEYADRLKSEEMDERSRWANSTNSKLSHTLKQQADKTVPDDPAHREEILQRRKNDPQPQPLQPHITKVQAWDIIRDHLSHFPSTNEDLLNAFEPENQALAEEMIQQGFKHNLLKTDSANIIHLVE